ncbi:MAG TPA: hypothetical protein VKX25_19435 [Bryobacteraceae bacterium]|jgi:hypothetical protein|nr:hypothetical protein [Bryobacteraceae bacterium]
MGTTSTFPNQQTLASTALTPDSLLTVLQKLVAQILGFNPTSNTDAAYSSVRVEWPEEGQPGFTIDSDYVFLRATEDDDDYAHLRDTKYATNDQQSVRLTMTYIRVWRVHLTFYGPASFDHARLVADAMFLDWVHDALAASSLFLITDFARPVYAPERFQGQWWKRTDLELRFNERVVDTLILPSIASSEVLIYDAAAKLADLTIT